jgi:hypothetical protein
VPSTASHPRAQVLAARIAAALRAQGVDVEAPEVPGPALLTLPGEAACGLCEGVLALADLETGEAVPGEAVPLVLMQVIYRLPLRLPKGTELLAAHTLLAMINPEVPTGAFELDPDDGAVRLRWSILIPAEPAPPDGFLLAPIYEALNLVDAWFAAFAATIEGGVHPVVAHAEGLVRLVEADEETFDADASHQLILRLQSRAPGQFSPFLLARIRGLTA